MLPSGLDAFQAQNVMESLWGLARSGRSVLASIHQPRSSIYKMFDLLLLLSEGKTIYFGPAAKVRSRAGRGDRASAATTRVGWGQRHEIMHALVGVSALKAHTCFYLVRANHSVQVPNPVPALHMTPSQHPPSSALPQSPPCPLNSFLHGLLTHLWRAGMQAVAWFEALGFPCPAHYNPADFFLDVVSMDHRTQDAEASSRVRIELLAEEFKKMEDASGDDPKVCVCVCVCAGRGAKPGCRCRAAGQGACGGHKGVLVGSAGALPSWRIQPSSRMCCGGNCLPPNSVRMSSCHATDHSLDRTSRAPLPLALPGPAVSPLPRPRGHQGHEGGQRQPRIPQQPARGVLAAAAARLEAGISRPHPAGEGKGEGKGA